LNILRGIAPYTIVRSGESCRIQPAIDSLIREVWISQDLIRTIGAETAAQRRIESRRYGEIAARLQPHDTGYLPRACQQTQCGPGELRRFVYSRHIEQPPGIAWAAGSVIPTASRIVAGSCLVAAGYKDVADAVRPSEIALNRKSLRLPALNREQ